LYHVTREKISHLKGGTMNLHDDRAKVGSGRGPELEIHSKFTTMEKQMIV